LFASSLILSALILQIVAIIHHFIFFINQFLKIATLAFSKFAANVCGYHHADVAYTSLAACKNRCTRATALA